MVNYKKKKVVIIGLGITGLSCVNFFLRRGVVPKVMDTRRYPPFLNKLPHGVCCYLGNLNEDCLLTASLIVLSPSITLQNTMLIKAVRLGIEIIGDIELFAREVTKPVIAITGSNGKSTVTKLLSDIAICAGFRVGVGGNMGYPVLNLLDYNYDLYIIELSSFQLETTYSLRTIASTILNISHEHMDRYPLGFQEYRSIKLKIYQNATICVVNAIDPLTFPINMYNKYCVDFGIKSSRYRLQHQGNKILVVTYNDRIILNCMDLQIIGYHNYVNILAIFTLASILNISHKICLKILLKFSGLPHCFQLVHYKNGIKWINDSKSTNVASTQAALSNFKLNIDNNLHLLLGGDGKSADFTPLQEYVQRDRVYLYCFGTDRYNFSKLKSKNIFLTDTMQQAMYMIRDRVKFGDIVLLSPACSSLDQFKNFEERGNIFTNIAHEIG